MGVGWVASWSIGGQNVGVVNTVVKAAAGAACVPHNSTFSTNVYSRVVSTVGILGIVEKTHSRCRHQRV